MVKEKSGPRGKVEGHELPLFFDTTQMFLKRPSFTLFHKCNSILGYEEYKLSECISIKEVMYLSNKSQCLLKEDAL